jgi:hypothetical protein
VKSTTTSGEVSTAREQPAIVTPDRSAGAWGSMAQPARGEVLVDGGADR